MALAEIWTKMAVRLESLHHLGVFLVFYIGFIFCFYALVLVILLFIAVDPAGVRVRKSKRACLFVFLCMGGPYLSPSFHNINDQFLCRSLPEVMLAPNTTEDHPKDYQ